MYRLIVSIGFVLTVTGCATITRGGTEYMFVDSTPTGADVIFTNGLTCRTPCAIKVDRRPGFSVTVEKEGYKPSTTIITSEISGTGGTALAGNVLFGGLIGIGVDAKTGAMNDLTPNPLHIELEAKD